MRRRRRAGGSSLELLLDTICNTFGGVLFLALLVALLLQLRGASGSLSTPNNASQRRLAEERERTEELKAQLESLQNLVGRQTELIEDLSPPELASQLHALDGFRNSLTTLVARRADIATELAAIQQSINDTAQDIADTESALKAAHQEHESMMDALGREVESRTVQARLPVLHETSKDEFSFCLRYGRLYRVFDGGSINSRDFDVESALGTVGVTPKRNGGQPLGRGAEAKALFNRAIDRIDPSTTYLAVFVWPDSYGEFQEVKAVMLEKQFEYRLVPLTDATDTLWQGGANAKVLR